MPRTHRPPVLNVTAVSRWLSAAGFRRYRFGLSGFEASVRPDGAVEVYHLGEYGQVLDPGPQMRQWGLRLEAVGFTVHVNEDTHLLVTGGAHAAPHAVERAA